MRGCIKAESLMSINKNKHKARMLALRLRAMGIKTGRQVFSFDEMGVSFQAPYAMDLREKGIILFGIADDGKPGCYLTPMAAAMNGQEIQQYINRIL